MCDTIRFKNGNDIETIEQFEKQFNVDARQYLYAYYDDVIVKDACLCQIDLDRFFKEHQEYMFYYDCGDWWEQS